MSIDYVRNLEKENRVLKERLLLYEQHPQTQYCNPVAEEGEDPPTDENTQNTITLPLVITEGPGQIFTHVDEAMAVLPELYQLCYTFSQDVHSNAYIMAVMDDHQLLTKRNKVLSFVKSMMVLRLLPCPATGSALLDFADRTAHNISTTLRNLKPGYRLWGSYNKGRGICETMGAVLEKKGFSYRRK